MPQSHAGNELGEYPHDWLVNVFQSGKMDADFCREFALAWTIRTSCIARLTPKRSSLSSWLREPRTCSVEPL